MNDNVLKELPDSKISTNQKLRKDIIIKTDDHEYKIIEYIGSGSHGQVFMAINENRKYVAIKECTNINETMDTFIKEINILKILQGSSCRKDIICPEYFFKNSEMNKMYIVTDYIQGEQLDDLDDDCIEECYTYITIKILRSLKYINEFGIIHGDIKPSNIMCVFDGQRYQPIIIDFGLSCLVEEQLRQCQSNGGSIYYTAPELLHNNILYENSDIWSLGITIYESMFGQAYENIDIKNFQQQLMNICSKESKLKIPKFETNLSLLNNICNDMLECDYKKRMTASMLLEKYKYDIDKFFLSI